MKYALMVMTMVIGFFLGRYSVNLGEGVDLQKVNDRGQYAASYESLELLANQGVQLNPRIISLAAEDVKAQKAKLSPEEIRLAKAALMTEAQKNGDRLAAQALSKAKAYLAELQKSATNKVLPSGLVVEVLSEGNGLAPQKTDWIEMTYEGKLQDGSLFESSKSSGGAVRVPVSNLLPGIQEAVTQMKTGSRWKVTLPPELGYGARVRPGLPANTILVFDLTLHSVIKK